jgi:hypothetical protein
MDRGSQFCLGLPGYRRVVDKRLHEDRQEIFFRGGSMNTTATSVSPLEAKTLWESGQPVLFIDARNAEAWANSGEKLPKAIRVRPEDLDEHLHEIPKNAVIIAYCT